MKYTAKELRKKLLSLIKKLGKTPELYSVIPGRDFSRRRALDFESVIFLLLTMGSKSVGKGMMEHFKFQTDTPSASAFVQQRKKLLPKALEDLFHSFTGQLQPGKTFRGYRLLAVDGSSLKSAAYPQAPLSYLPGTDRQHGWNKHLLNALFDLENGIYTDLTVQPEHGKDEGKALCEMVDRSSIAGPAIVLADRNYGSLNNLAHLENRGWKYVIRLKERDRVFGIPLPDSPVFDIPVTLTLGRLTKRRMEMQNIPVPEGYCHLAGQRTFDFLPVGSTESYALSFRIVRIKTGGKIETLLTNLDTKRFPPEELGALYSKRWGVETSFRCLKYTVGLIHLHAKIPSLVLQEVFAAFLIFNFTQALSWAVELSLNKHKHRLRLNFSDAVFACCNYLRCPVKGLETLLGRKRLPIKPGRAFRRLCLPETVFPGFMLLLVESHQGEYRAPGS